MQESLTNSTINVEIKYFNPDIPDTGFFFNFGYIQVFFKDENNNLILQNEPTLNSYSTPVSKNEIGTFDQNTYGIYAKSLCL